MLKISHTYLITALLFSSGLYATQYKASFIGTENIGDASFSHIRINNKGQVYGNLSKDLTQSVFISDPQTGLSIFNGNEIPKKIRAYDGSHILNNNNQMLVQAHYHNVAIWNLGSELQFIKTPNKENVNARGFNDLGQVIGTYTNEHHVYQPFFWEKGVITDMGAGSEFAKKFEELGYHVTNLALESLNDNGDLAGSFMHGKYNVKQKRYIELGERTYFYWNGSMNIISIPKGDGLKGTFHIKINNTGSALLTNEYRDTYLWDTVNGLQELPDFEGHNLNDSNVILGRSAKFPMVPAIWKNGTITTIAELLNVEDLANLAPDYSDSYQVEEIKDFKGINNKGQILAYGRVWGEWHPCIIEPIE